MHIEWTITKKRGWLRPTLTYTITLEAHEKALALPEVSVLSSIPKPEEERQEHCPPGRFERAASANIGAASGSCHELETPSHTGHPWPRSLRLPWRANNEYPEVEASFLLLRDAFEKELAAAYASLPMQDAGSLRTSDRAKSGIAPGILAERFLQLAEKSVRQAG